MTLRCRFCGCTQENGCPAICSWEETDRCSVCARFQRAMRRYGLDARRVTKASLGRMLDEITAPFMSSPAPKARKAKAAK